MHSHDRTQLTQKLGFRDPDKKNKRHDLACQYLTNPETIESLAGYFLPYITKPIEVRGDDSYHCAKVDDKILYSSLSYNNCKNYLHGLTKVGDITAKTFSGEIAEPDRTIEYYNNLCLKKYFSKDGTEIEISKLKLSYEEIIECNVSKPSNLKAKSELPLNKGQGKYKTTLGFLDAVLSFSWSERRVGNITYNHPSLDTSALLKSVDYEKSLSGVLFVEVKISPVGVGDILRQIAFYKEYIPLGSEGHSDQYWNYLSRLKSNFVRWVVVTDFDLSKEDKKQLQQHHISHFKLGPKFEEFVEKASSEPAKSVLI
jgi:hypothetical protein